jgi:hypothetical protein
MRSMVRQRHGNRAARPLGKRVLFGRVDRRIMASRCGDFDHDPLTVKAKL